MSLTAKQFRTEVGREIRRVRKLQKEKWNNGRRYYLRVLRTTYDILGITPEKLAVMNPKLRAETMIYIKGIVGWTNFLLTIQPRERKLRRKTVEGHYEIPVVEGGR